MSQRAKENPSTPSSAHTAMAPRLKRAKTLLGGTDAMRAAAEEYLPVHPEETSRGYNERLSQNVLFNFYALTLSQLAAKPFAEPIAIGEDVPQNIQDMLENVDLQGSTLDAFCIEWFKEAMRGAFAGVLVDFPRVDEKIDEQGNPIPRTRADDARDGLRPYAVLVSPENILFAETQRIGGVEVLTHLRILEDVVGRDGFEETHVEQIRILEPGIVSLWRRVDPRRSNSRWAEMERYETSLPVVPFVFAYTNKEGIALGTPPLDDVTQLNIRHWQSMSDQIRALTTSRFAMLVIKGTFTEGEKSIIRVGAEQAIGIPSDGDVKWLESTGTGSEQGRQELIDLEERMSAYGAQLLKRQPGNPTATARALDTAEAVSPLQAMAMSFQSAVEEMLDLFAQWTGQESGGSVKVHSDFHGTDDTDANALAVLTDANTRLVISRLAYINELKRRNILAEDYDPDEDAAAIEEDQSKALANAAAMIDLDPAADDEDDNGKAAE